MHISLERQPLRMLVMVTVCLVLAGGTANAQGNALASRLSLHLNGGFQSSSKKLRSVVLFTVYDEEGQIQTEQQTESGPIIDVGGSLRVWRQLSIGALYTNFNSSNSAELTGAVPHPFVFHSQRSIVPQDLVLRHREQVIHIPIAWVVPVSGDDQLAIKFFGGPSYFHLTRSAPTNISITETGLPFADLTVRVGATETMTAGWGGHAGVDVVYFLTDRLGIGGFVRYATGSIDVPGWGNFTVGGIQGGGGFRIRFS